jgi:long-chain fatty acid transport protein
VKSPQWFEPFTFNSVAANGGPVRPTFTVNFPLIASVGAGYRGIDRLLIALDLRFLDYRNTQGFSHVGFNDLGALRGVGWQNVFAVAVGAQYLLTDEFSVRAGYLFNLNPIGNAITSFNVGAPTNIQNTIALGASYDVTKALKISLAYLHYFQNSNTGPIIEPRVGAVPGSLVRLTSTGDSVVLGASVSF